MSDVPNTDLVPPENTESPQSVVAAPVQTAMVVPTADLISAAKTDGLDVGKLKELIALQNSELARQAERDCQQAMSQFSANCPKVQKKSSSDQFQQVGRDGVSRDRRYASLEDIGEVIEPELPKYGLSMRWGDTDIKDRFLVKTCIVSHRNGHSVSSTITMPYDTTSGASAQQKFLSVESYAKRSTLVSVLGIILYGEDNDGRVEEDEADGAAITTAQVQEIEDLIEGTDSNRPKLLGAYSVKSVAEMTVTQYESAKQKLEWKRDGKYSGQKETSS